MSEIIGLFPIPLMRVPKLLDDGLLAVIAGQIADQPKTGNAKSGLLSHTDMIVPSSKGPFFRIAKLVAPKLAEFGAELFGETLEWSVKEMWVNVLETGGAQAIHAHANSFISGILYVTPSDPSANTVFAKNLGSTEFVFSNQNRRSRMGPFNGGKWVLPGAGAGDLVLFPSYLLHEVPTNQGAQRITVAFNAIPDHLDNWGYTVRFHK